MAGEKADVKADIKSTTPSGVSDDSKLWAAIGYPIWILPLLVMVTEDKKKDKWLLFHAYQSLILGVVLFLIVSITSMMLIGCLLAPLAFLAQLYFGYRAYKGEKFLVPFIGEYAQKQVK
jgi:uncharacterized membrane protein